MRKGIVLLITIFFISAISILILQNLKNTEEYLDTISFDTKLSQTQISMDNIQDEIPKFFKKNKDNIDQILENTAILPLSFGDINVLLNIVLIPRYGPIGAAVATTISYVAGSITYLIIFMKLTELGIWTCILISRKDFSYLISIFSKQLTLMKNSINSVG